MAVALRVEQLLGLAERVLVLIEVMGFFAPRVLKQEDRYPKELLVRQVHVQLELIWGRGRERKRVQAQSR